MDTDLCGCLSSLHQPLYAENRTLLLCQAMNVTSSSTTPLSTAAAVQPARGTSPWMYAVIGVVTVFIIAIAAALYNMCELFRTGPRPRRKTAAAAGGGKGGPSSLTSLTTTTTTLPQRGTATPVPLTTTPATASQYNKPSHTPLHLYPPPSSSSLLLQNHPPPHHQHQHQHHQEVTYQNVPHSDRAATPSSSSFRFGPGSGRDVEAGSVGRGGDADQTGRKACVGGEESEHLLSHLPVTLAVPPPPPHPAQLATSGLPRSHNRRYYYYHHPGWEARGPRPDSGRRRRKAGLFSACFSGTRKVGEEEDEEDEEDEDGEVEEEESEVRFRQKLYTNVRSCPSGQVGERWGEGVYRTRVEVHAKSPFPARGEDPRSHHHHHAAAAMTQQEGVYAGGGLPLQGKKRSVSRQAEGVCSKAFPHKRAESAAPPSSSQLGHPGDLLAARPAALWTADPYQPPPSKAPAAPSLPHQPSTYAHVAGRERMTDGGGGGGRLLSVVAEDSFAEADSVSVSSLPRQSPDGRKSQCSLQDPSSAAADVFMDDDDDVDDVDAKPGPAETKPDTAAGSPVTEPSADKGWDRDAPYTDPRVLHLSRTPKDWSVDSGRSTLPNSRNDSLDNPTLPDTNPAASKQRPHGAAATWSTPRDSPRSFRPIVEQTRGGRKSSSPLGVPMGGSRTSALPLQGSSRPPSRHTPVRDSPSPSSGSLCDSCKKMVSHSDLPYMSDTPESASEVSERSGIETTV